jgi:hypothetical protein
MRIELAILAFEWPLSKTHLPALISMSEYLDIINRVIGVISNLIATSQ